MIKILHINCNYMATNLHQTMIEHLNEYIENEVFCPLRKEVRTTTVANNNVKAIECFNKFDRLLFFKKQKQIIDTIEENYDINSFDLIHAYTLMTDGNVAMQLSKKYNIPYVVAVRDTDINTFFKYKPYLIPSGNEIMRRASNVFFLSSSYKKIMLEHYVSHKKNIDIEKKSKVISNGIDDFWLNNIVDLSKERISRIKNRNINIVCVAQIIKRKNLPLLKQAIDVVREDGWNVHFDIIGKIVDDLEFNKIGFDIHTEYHEPMPKEKLIDYYRKADLFALISHTETFGLVYAEAMSQGLPVIYTKGQGFDGQFPEGTVGYAVSDIDINDVVIGIEKVLNGYDNIVKNVSNMSKIFNWNEICDTYLKIYQKILE